MTYREIEVISTAFLILAGVSFFVMAEYEPKSRVTYSLIEWFVRVTLLGWILSVIIEVALFPTQFGASINALFRDIGL